jgi:hypothetical protein
LLKERIKAWGNRQGFAFVLFGDIFSIMCLSNQMLNVKLNVYGFAKLYKKCFHVISRYYEIIINDNAQFVLIIVDLYRTGCAHVLMHEYHISHQLQCYNMYCK